MFLEILLEGAADVPAVKIILERRFNLLEGRDFRLHPHHGRGRLPENPNRPPDPRHRGLLDQLPAKLRGYSSLPEGYCVVVLMDSDEDDCRELKSALVELYHFLPRRPECVLFRIAVEETESWFLADREALNAAYPKSETSRLLKDYRPDTVIGAWELLARVVGTRPEECLSGEKKEWARRITPHLDLASPKSPSLSAFIRGIEGLRKRQDLDARAQES